MRQFKTKGFLSLSYRTNLKTVKDTDDALTKMLLMVIEAGWTLQHELEVDHNNLEQVHSVTLYSRIVNSIQAAHLLAVYGLGVQSSNQCRAAMECLFQLAALNNKKELFPRLMLSAMENSLRYAKTKRCHKSQNMNFSHAQLAADDLEIDELQKRIDVLMSKGIMPLSKIKPLAEEADMIYWYELMYQRLSWDTHSSLESLQEHVHIGDDGEISHVINEPNFRNFSSNTYCSLKVICRAIQEVYKAVGETPSAALDSYIKKLDELRFDESIFQAH